MALARTLLRDHLTANLPGVTVRPYADVTDQPGTSTVMLRYDETKPGPSRGTWTYLYALVLLPITSTNAADDELDALLADVLHALDKTATGSGITWTGAKRGLYAGGTVPAIEVSVTLTVTAN